MRFSIVISTYNRDATLENTLQSLRYLRHSDFEVIVVNGPSTDDTANILSRFSGLIRVGLCAEANISKSRNIGINMARGEIIAFIDDDAVPELNWLDQLESHFAVEPRVAGVGGFVRDNTGVSFQCKYIVCDRHGDAQFFEDEVSAHIDQQPHAERFYSLIGVNSAFRRSALLDIGGFDEEYAYFLDETDVCARLTDAGWLIRQVPNAEVYHNFAPSHLRDNQRIPKSLYFVARSKTYFAFRNALPNVSLESLFIQAEDVREQIRRQADRLHATQLISNEQHQSLLNDADKGLRQGINDAFSYPAGQPLQIASPGDDLDFQRLMPLRESAERLRLILITQDYPPRACGGVGVFMYHLAAGLAAEGHEVSVITRSDGGHTVDFEEGVWVHRIQPQSHANRNHPPLPDLPQGLKDYAYSVYDEAIRIQCIRGASTTIASIWDLESAGCVASPAFNNVVYLVTTYKLCLPSKPEWESNKHFREQHVGKVIRGEEWILKNCQQVIASTPSILRDVAELYGIQLPAVPVIPFGLPNPSITKVAKDTHSERLKVLFVGRLEKRKGADLLLEVIPGLLTQHMNIEFQLAGNDQLIVGGKTLKAQFYERCPQLIHDERVKFFGHVDDCTLEELYADCDVFTAPSTYESFGLIFLEAMRCSKPCIGTAVGGIPDVLSDASGILIPPGDALALSEAITTLVEDRSLRLQLGEEGRRVFERRFSLETFVHGMEDQLSRTIRRVA